MIGNVYVQFKEEDQAAAALQALQGRFYSGRPIIADFSPVTDFREATCRQYEENNCNRGGYCNFMHVKLVSRELRRKLFGRYKRSYRRGSRSRSRSKSISPRHKREYDRRDPPPHTHREFSHRDRDREFYRHGSGKRSSERKRQGSPPKRGGSPPGGGREGSEERRARIEQWNREKEDKEDGGA